MKLLTKLPTLVLLAFLTYSCSTDNVDENVEKLASKDLIVPAPKTIEIEILELINDHRLSVGLNPLKNMDIIKSQAYNHTDYMIEQNQVSHDNFYERKSFLTANTGAKAVSENVAYGFTSAQSVVNAWLNSEGHKQNIEGNFSDFDISAEKNADGKWYYTNIFIKK
ncbi:CAP domain-containing protein [Yeosuana sp. MJ-SS3]|uniref:CAP domain-containing protein n=1 Tax=Gilvirhabdus luticola TaxID=3079858 RepID=A0ABU3UA09_9FLAO|nr:CAP domain-containing protein [Yeosuana sp. MJ-SS3]MDU8887245.1 CAP domain-containing protein [Yeosuana sp. MJ-SS3]